MEQIEQRLAILEQKIDAMSVIVKRLYMIFLIGAIVSVLAVIVPFIGLLFVIPKFISNYNAMLGI